MGNINKRLFDKYIEKIGWPELLYQTLKGFYNTAKMYEHLMEHEDPSTYGSALEEVKDVLEAYEEYPYLKDMKSPEARTIINGHKKQSLVEKMGFKASYATSGRFPGKEPSNSSSQIVEDVSKVVVADKMEVDPNSLPRGNGQEEITRVTVLLPMKETIAQPRMLKGVVSIDSTIGDSQGMLPIPKDCQIVNRNKIFITTKSGMELGRTQMDGQVKESANVSGFIRTNGRYDLVFKDTKLGEAVIQYEVIEEKKPVESELKMISFLDSSGRKWISFIEGSAVEVKADTIGESKNQLLDILVESYGMQVISTAVLKRSEDNKEEIKSLPHVVLQPGGQG